MKCCQFHTWRQSIGKGPWRTTDAPFVCTKCGQIRRAQTKRQKVKR